MEENLKLTGELIIHTSDKITYHLYTTDKWGTINSMRKGIMLKDIFYPYHSIVKVELNLEPNELLVKKDSLVADLILN